MEVRELRIGNLVYRTNKQTKEKIVLELTASCILDISANGEISSFIYEPIPITEEWLLRFGFVKSSIDSNNAWLNLRYRQLNFASDESVKFKKVFLNVNKILKILQYL